MYSSVQLIGVLVEICIEKYVGGMHSLVKATKKKQDITRDETHGKNHKFNFRIQAELGGIFSPVFFFLLLLFVGEVRNKSGLDFNKLNRLCEAGWLVLVL